MNILNLLIIKNTKKTVYLKSKVVELVYWVDYFQHIELYPEFKIKGDEEE